MTDISSAIAFVLIAGIAAFVTYGFTDWFERLFGIKTTEPATSTVLVPQTVPVDKSQETEALQQVRGRVTLEFLLTSTTDWFEIGIENGTLVALEEWETAREPATHRVTSVVPFPDHIQIKPDGPQLLRMSIKATFEVPKYGVSCVLRKADSGYLEVKVMMSAFLHPMVGKYSYTSTAKEKNEVTFRTNLFPSSIQSI